MNANATESKKQQFQSCLQEGAKCGTAGDFEAASEHFRTAVKLCPEDPEGHFNLGVALASSGRLTDAIESFCAAIRFRPQWPEAQFNLGNAYRDVKQRDKAIVAFEKAIQAKPGYLKAMNNLANLYLEQGHLRKAEGLLQQALSLKGDYPEGLFNLGRVFSAQRRYVEAAELMSKAIHLQPGNKRFQLGLAEVQELNGNPNAAYRTLREVLGKESDHPEAVIKLAALWREQGKFAKALSVLDEAVLHRKFNAKTLVARAEIRCSMKQLDEAIQDIQSAIKLDPTIPEAHNILGVIHFEKGEVANAIACYERAVQIRPAFVEAYNNLGTALQTAHRFGESREAFDTALRLKPDFALARLNRSLNLLANGEFEEGWREFEWRFLCPDTLLPRRDHQTWTGETLAGKTILLRAEQGLGDTFQFIRYASLVKQRCAKVVVECQKAALELVSTCHGVDVVCASTDPLPNVDAEVRLLSLPSIFHTTLADVPNRVPYLAADPDRISAWSGRLGAIDSRVIGIAWQGNRKFKGDTFRSIKLKHFEPLAAVAGNALVSLQQGDGTEQLQDLPFAVHSFDNVDVDGPFCDTAAMIACCDLVITSDTSIAHLAGALGKPVWVALPYAADWRWLAEGDTSPWYPTMRLFRQPTPGDWASVFSSMAEALSMSSPEPSQLSLAGCTSQSEIRVETAPGELLDKITILEIKRERFQDEQKLRNVTREWESLQATRRACLHEPPELAVLIEALRAANKELWDIEDEIRTRDQLQDFGPDFVELAKAVYRTNDRRAELKRDINQLLGARFHEEKSYAPYTPKQPLIDWETYRDLALIWDNEEVAATIRTLREQARKIAARCHRMEATDAAKAGIAIGHYDSPDFLALNLAAVRKHCGNVPVLVADDQSPGYLERDDGSSFARIVQIVKADPFAELWTNHVRRGHFGGDLSALAKGITWASALHLDVLFKLSQRLVINRADWVREAADQLKSSQAKVLGRGCTHFGWRTRTESMAIDVPAWDRDEILARLLSNKTRGYVEDNVSALIDEFFEGDICEWALLSASRQDRNPEVFFRATHCAEEYAELAVELGLGGGNYSCSLSEFQPHYKQ